MKKINIFIIVFFILISSFSQNSLEGKWKAYMYVEIGGDTVYVDSIISGVTYSKSKVDFIMLIIMMDYENRKSKDSISTRTSVIQENKDFYSRLKSNTIKISKDSSFVFIDPYCSEKKTMMCKDKVWFGEYRNGELIYKSHIINDSLFLLETNLNMGKYIYLRD